MSSRKMLVQITFLVTLFIAPTFGSAQTFFKASGNSNLARAIQIHDEAVALYAYPDRAWDAARLHILEVKYRSASDPEAIESLAMAAHLFGYAGRPADARKVMEQAAVRALSNGDVDRAAQAYLQAAFFAQKETNKTEAKRLVEKAMVLTRSPSITASVRDAIQERIRTSVAVN